MKGILFGLGVGPGDPELLTLKAVRVIAECSVIAYPAPENGISFARKIASEYISDDKTEIIIRTPMIAGSFPANAVYDKYANRIQKHLREGRDVAVLCEGDPFFYGSFSYIYCRLAGKFPTKVIPGVSSLGTCAAVAGRPLALRNNVLSIVPATLEFDELLEKIDHADSIAVIKVGKHLDKVRNILNKLGLVEWSYYVEHASMENQRVLPLDQTYMTIAPYFSMVLVQKSGEY